MARAFALIALLMCISCHSSKTEPIIEEPGPPPLPPASGTAIGILLDESTKLALRPDQIDRLHEIDQQLSTRNASLDEQLAAMDRPVEASGEQSGMGGMGGGRRHRGGGMRGGGSGNAQSAHHHRPQQGAGSGASGGAHQKLQDEEAANTKDALERAFAALDPDQQTKARAILDERGVTGAPESPASEDGSAASDGAESGSDN